MLASSNTEDGQEESNPSFKHIINETKKKQKNNFENVDLKKDQESEKWHPEFHEYPKARLTEVQINQLKSNQLCQK